MRRFIIIAVLGLLCASCGDGPATTTTSIRKEDEASHPASFIKVNYEVRRNLVGKKVVEGSVLNTGKHLSYNTITLRITAIKDGDENSVNYTVSEKIAPGEKAEFKFKPEGNPDRVEVAVAGATAD
jgi:hypothetical protein